MSTAPTIDLSYFPGCSLATTAKESNQSLIECCHKMGIRLIEVPDWNCCGSSSAHSIDHDLAIDLAGRNLALAPAGRPLVAACPSCTLHLKQAQHRLKTDEGARQRYEKLWGRPFHPDLRVRHFFGPLAEIGPERLAALNGHVGLDLSFVPYYGCMLNRPYELRATSEQHGIMERILQGVGMRPLPWAHGSRCCGTFLTVSRPDIVTPMVSAIMKGAAESGADCIVTACAMCHMNLEVRCTVPHPIPIFHFSEILALAYGTQGGKNWFARHLIDPRPLLTRKGLYPSSK